VFGDRTSGAYLPKFAWTKIVRHSLVRGDASPDDPAQAGYWADRRRKTKPLLDRRTLHLLRRQNGTCPICGHLLLHADREPQSPHEWEQWHRTTRRAITEQHIIAHGTGLPDETQLVHATCRRRTGGQQDPAPLYS
jgi:RNA-directed DNA polymerase